jgi:integrase
MVSIYFINRTRVDRKTGQKITKRSKRAYIEYFDEHGKRRRVPGYKDKASTLKKASEIATRVERIKAGVILPDEQAVDLRSIYDHLQEYLQNLQNAERTANYIKLIQERLRIIFEGLRISKLTDLIRPGTEERFAEWLIQKRKLPASSSRKISDQPFITPTTRNHYRRAMLMFVRFLFRKRRIPSLLFQDIRRANQNVNRRHVRRAITNFQIGRLIITARRSKRMSYGLSGRERAMLYLFAVGTGLRVSELASLTWADIDLDDEVPSVRIKAENAKNRTSAYIPLHPILVERIRSRQESQSPLDSNGQLFPGGWSGGHGARMLRKDLREAGIEYEVNGKVFDFHALRGQFATMLARGGVPLQHAQQLLRHSDPSLTANMYTHLNLQDLARAIGADRVGSKTEPPNRTTRKNCKHDKLDVLAESQTE